jgi:phosphate transport system substrate-binding protein
MRIFTRSVGILLLLALIISPTVLSAQEDDTPVVIGSGIVAEILEAIFDTGEVEAAIDINVTGTTSGLSAFCRGDTDAAGANRPLLAAEEEVCADHEIEFDEYLVGYDIGVLIAHPELEFATCLSGLELATILAPSARDQITDWSQTGLTEESLALSIYLPPDDTTTYALFDRVVDGVGLRGDAITEADAQAIVAAVGDTPGSIGLVSLSDLRDVDTVRVVELESPEIGDCFAPAAEAVDNRQYDAADRLFLYVNRASTGKSGLQELLSALLSEDNASIIVEAGFSAPSTDAYALNQTILTGEETGRQFTLETAIFEIPENLFGTIVIGGSSHLFNYLQEITTEFTMQYSGVVVELDLEGEPGGIRRLCNGEIDVLVASRDLPEEAQRNCAANNIETAAFNLGSLAVVLVANSADDHLTCLTPDQVLTIWGAPSAESVESWSDVDADFPDTELFLFAPNPGAVYTDWLLRPAEGPVIPLRDDVTETNNDPLYRAAATANVSGALTFMTWPDYQRVLANEQANIQAVAVDGGQGCVEPSVITISDQSYPYAISGQLIVNNSLLTAPELQSLLWYLFMDANYTRIERAGLIGLSFGELPAIRDRLQTLYDEALADSLAPEPEITPEVEAEATPDEPEDDSPEETPDPDNNEE